MEKECSVSGAESMHTIIPDARINDTPCREKSRKPETANGSENFVASYPLRRVGSFVEIANSEPRSICDLRTRWASAGIFYMLSSFLNVSDISDIPVRHV
jgi:hypothetical protein